MAEDKKSFTRKIKNVKVVKENHLDFLYELFNTGVELNKEELLILRDTGYFKDGFIPEAIKEENNKDYKGRPYDPGYFIDHERENGEPILRHEWLPESVTEHSPEFVKWINSINNLGFKNRTKYYPFTLYVQQAQTWLKEEKSYNDFFDDFQKEEYMLEEMRRCDENALYFLDKYVYYKDADIQEDGGRVKYKASPIHAFFAYLDDCGYSYMLAKGRQIAATTTQMSLDVRNAIFKTNHIMKFICEDETKVEEIFEDKFKAAFYYLPDWMKPNVINESADYFKLGNKSGKGDKGGVNSQIMIVPPKRTAIAGGAPNTVKIDEAGNIKLLSKMINNAAPTRLMFNPKTRKLQVKRRMVVWGTGGEMERGGMAFQTELLALFKDWNDQKYDSAMIPLFFDWTCRPGATQEDYDREKRKAYSKVGEELEDSIIEFHQSWPKTLSDVFITSSKTMFSMEYIDGMLEEINKVKVKKGFNLVQRGYFEPIFDENSPAHETSDVPYKIIGANFVPTEDIDPRATAYIFSHPKPDWKDRYFSGTDPIQANTGTSYMASAIWDKHFHTIAAIVDTRTKDYNDSFLQCHLLNLYYGQNSEKTKELLEANIGTAYYEYVKTKGDDDSLVLNYELPAPLRNNTTINEGVGIDNKGTRNAIIINYLYELTSGYGMNIFMEIFWNQLKTFTSESTDGGKSVWGPSNRKYFRDDVLFAAVYAYICAEKVYYDRIPTSLAQEAKKVVYRDVLDYDKDFNLVRKRVKVSV